MEAENNGSFKQHLFRNLLGVGMIVGGMAGWLLSSDTDVRLFCTVMGACGGMFIGFLFAMFISG